MLVSPAGDVESQYTSAQDGGVSETRSLREKGLVGVLTEQMRKGHRRDDAHPTET